MTVYRGFERDELEAQYDVVATVPSLEAYLTHYQVLSDATVSKIGGTLDIAYGDDPLQTLDWFSAESGGAPMLVYLHGGYWTVGDKAGCRFPAEVFTAAGVAWAPVNYRLAPSVSLDDIVADTRHAIAWLYHNAASLGADPDRLYVCGSSAGGQLASMLLAQGWQAACSVPADVIKGVCTISGIHDLEPLLHISHQQYLQLDLSAVRRNSPIHNLPPETTPLIVSWGGMETPEFERQSKDYAAACSSAGLTVETLYLKQHNHFSLADELGRQDSSLTRLILDMMALH